MNNKITQAILLSAGLVFAVASQASAVKNR